MRILDCPRTAIDDAHGSWALRVRVERRPGSGLMLYYGCP